MLAESITDEQILVLMQQGLVGDAGSAALGESVNRGHEGDRAPTVHERQIARAYCAEIFKRKVKQ